MVDFVFRNDNGVSVIVKTDLIDLTSNNFTILQIENLDTVTEKSLFSSFKQLPNHVGAFKVFAEANNLTLDAFTNGKNSLLSNVTTAVISPLAVPNMLAWFDVTDSSSVIQSTGTASQLTDKSGNNRHLVQATAGSRPAYNANGGANNKAYLAMSGKNMQTSVTNMNIVGQFTMYAMVKQVAFADGTFMFAFKTDGGTGVWRVQHSLAGGTNNVSAYFGGAVLPTMRYGYRTKWSLFKMIADGPGSLKITIDDEPITLDRIVATTAPSSIAIDYFMLHSANYQFSEKVYYSGDVSAANDLALKTYFRLKYATTNDVPIIFLGDSHTQGLNSTGANSYVKLVEAEIGKPAYNNGASGTVVWPFGSYTGNTPTNLNAIYTNWLNAPKRSYVIFQYGTNDGNNPATQPNWKANYKAYIQAYIDAGFDKNKIIICTPPYNTNATYATNLANAYPIIQAIASELGIRLADFRAAHIAASYDVNLIGGDGIHMNDAGHRICADTLKLQIV